MRKGHTNWQISFPPGNSMTYYPSATDQRDRFTVSSTPTSVLKTPSRKLGVPLVLAAGIFWSTGGLFYRLIDEATPWQVLLYRSAALWLMLCLWLVIRYRLRTKQIFLWAGLPAVIGGLCLSVAFTGFILAMEFTTVANALFILAAAPFFSALLGRILLSEPISRLTWVCMMVAAAGLAVMTGGELALGRGLGEFFALTAALGFSGLAVSLRTRQSTDMLPAIFFASLIAALFAAVGIVLTGSGLIVTPIDLVYSSSMGIFQVGAGFMLFTVGARHLLAVELTLLSLTEIIAGPILVWTFIGEIPSWGAFAGGFLILGAIVAMALLGASTTATGSRTPP